MKLTLKRKIAYLLYNLIGMHLPRTYMPYSFGSRYIRYFLVKHFITKCGNNIKIEPNVHLSPFIEIGNNVVINEGCRIRANVYIGNDVLIAPNVQMLSINHGYKEKDILIINQKDIIGNINIKDNIWIGTNVIILQNVIVESNSIIGAGSIVTKNVTKNSIFVGNPAKKIKNI
jgi:maltose O-acetyltransferase